MRRRKADSFTEGGYEPLDAGPDVCAFLRGDVLVAVPLRPGATFEPPEGFADTLAAPLPVFLYERA